MPSTTGFEFGDIVLVSFPFTSQAGRKQRPAAVISSKAYDQGGLDVILMAVTSRFRPTSRLGEVVVADWQAAGLLKPSIVKPVMFTMDKRLVIRKLGRLAAQDREALRAAMQAIRLRQDRPAVRREERNRSCGR